MFSRVDEDAWLQAMRTFALPAIRLAAEQIGDPAAAAQWTESEHSLSLARPESLRALLSFSRPDAGGEIRGAGQSALTFDYLPYAVAGGRGANPLVDAGVRRAVLEQVRGRERDAEVARLSPGERSPAWACTLDVMSWCALAHFMSHDEIAAIVSSEPVAPAHAEDHVPTTIDRIWHDWGSDASGLLYVHLVPDLGRLATDGLGFRLGPPGSPMVRVESEPSGHAVHVGIHGVNLPETAIANAVGRPLSRLLDDPALRAAADLLVVRSVSNHVQGEVGIVDIVCEEVRVRCAPAPAGATFAWERLRDPAAAIGRATRVLPYGSLQAR
jgi:hypothetical protein